MGRFRRKTSSSPPELDVTTFMNLMVVLVPFLLLSAAFSEITIHDLSLPTIAEGAVNPEDRNKLNLEVVIRREHLDVVDRNRGRLQLIPNRADQQPDLAALGERMRDIKAAYPQVTHVTLLLDPEVKYETLIATMDVVRNYNEPGPGKPVKRELFPDVSIGDAPKLAGGAS